MASKKLSYDQIAEQGLLDPLIAEITKINDLLKVTEQQLKDVVKVQATLGKTNPLKSYEDVKQAEEGIRKTTKAVEELDKVEKERVRLQEQLKALDDERVKSNIRLKTEIAAKQKAIKDNIKAEKEQQATSKQTEKTYAQESKRLNELRKRYKDLAVQNKGNTKESKALLKEITSLDEKLKDVDKSVGQTNRNVGNYQEEVEQALGNTKLFGVSLNQLGSVTLPKMMAGLRAGIGALASFGKALLANPIFLIGAVIAAVVAGMKVLFDAFKSTQRGADLLNRVLTPLKFTFEVLYGVIQDLALDAFDGLAKAMDDPIQAMKDLGGAIVDNVINRLKSFAVFGEAIVSFIEGDFTKGFEKLGDAAIQSLTGIEEATSKIKDAADETGDLIDSAIERGQELAALREKAVRQDKDLVLTNAQLRTEFELQKELAQDITLTDEQRINAAQRAIKAQNELIRVNQDYLNTRIQIKELENSANDTSIQDEKELNELKAESILVEAEAARKRASANNLLNKLLKDRQKAFDDEKESLSDIESQAIKAQEALIKLNEESINAQDAAMKKMMDKEMKAALEKLKREQEIKKKEIEAEKEKQEKIKEATEKGFKALEKVSSQYSEKQLSQIDSEIEASEKREDRLRELSEKGSQDATDNLAREQKKQAELELKREQEIRRQKKVELGLAAIQTYSAKVQAGEGNALASTLADITVLQALIEALPGFKEGTENTGTGGAIRDKDGVITGYTHENERVLTAEQNRMVGSMSNMELAMLAQTNRVKPKAQPDTALINEVKSLKVALAQRPSFEGMDYDKISNMVVDKVRKGNKLERIHKKTGAIWGN